MLQLEFVNLSGVADAEVFVTTYSDSGAAYDVGFGTPETSFEKKVSHSLAEIGAMGLRVRKFDAGRIYISFKDKWQITANLTQPSAVDPNDKWFRTRWDKFEITMNGANGDQANLTSIDFVGIPMRMETQDADWKVIQSFGYPDDNKVISKLKNANGSAAVSANADGTGATIRVLGPSQSGYPSIGGWPSFQEYVKDLHEKKQSTKIKFDVSHAGKKDDKPFNWNYAYDFDATVGDDFGITMTGTITAREILSGGAPAEFKGLGVKIAADSGKDTFLSSFVYSGAINTKDGVSNVVFSGDWNAVFAATTTEASVEVPKRIIGDLAVGMAYGFAGSADFKDSPSGEWYADGQKKVLKKLQPDHSFYSTYQEIIFEEALNNSMYGHPYSDRFKAYAVAANVVQFESADQVIHSITKLVVTILKPEAV